MRTTYLIAAALLLSAPAMAQRPQFGVEGGLNLANLSNKWEGEIVTGDMKVGFNAGVFADIPLGEIISVQPGLRYSLKGSRVDYSYENTMVAFRRESNLSLHYLELPVNLVFAFNGTSSPRGFFVGVGPYVATLLAANEKYSSRFRPGPSEEVQIITDRSADLKIGADDGVDYLRRMDYGGQAFIGYKWNNWMIKAGGQMGFAEIRYDNARPANSGLRGGETFQKNNYVFFLNIGYLFGGNGMAMRPTNTSEF